MQIKICGSRIVLKPDVVPHLYLENPPESTLKSQLSRSAQKRKTEVLLSLPSTSHGQVKRIKEVKKKLFAETDTLMDTPSKHCLVSSNESNSPSGMFLNESISPKVFNEKLPSEMFVSENVMPKLSTQNEASISKKNVKLQVNIKKSIRSCGINTIPINKESKSTMTVRQKYCLDLREKEFSENDSPFSKFSLKSALTISSASSDFLPSSQPSDLSSGNASEQEDCKSSQILRRKSTIHLIESNSRFYLGLPKDVYFLVSFLSQSNFNLRYDHVLITLKKNKVE